MRLLRLLLLLSITHFGAGKSDDDHVASYCQQVADVAIPEKDEVLSASQSVRDRLAERFVDPELAYQCLKSIRLDRDDALATVESIKRILGLHPNLAYYRNPSLGRLAREPLDIVAGLDRIAEGVKQDPSAYTGWYDFDRAISLLLLQAKDPHLVYRGYAERLFNFERPFGVALVSVSRDGIEPPELCLRRKAMANICPTITAINGQDPIQFLEQEALDLWSYSDDSTRFNQQLGDPSPSMLSSTFNVGGFILPAIYPGKETVLSYGDDKPTSTWPTSATVLRNNGWVSVRQGVDPYEALIKALPYVVPPDPGFKAEKMMEVWDALPYPPNGVRFQVVSIPEFGNVAVATLHSFAGDGESHASKLASFLRAQVKTQRPETIILDLRRNNGGWMANVQIVLNGLFPEVASDGDSLRFHAAEALDILATTYPEPLTPFPFNFPGRDADTEEHNYDPKTGAIFPDWQSLYGPHPLPNVGDQFSSLVKPTHYRPEAYAVANALEPHTFSTVVVLTDGICSSACALFVSALNESPSLQKSLKRITLRSLPVPAADPGSSGTNRMPLAAGSKTLGPLSAEQFITYAAHTLHRPDCPPRAADVLPIPPGTRIDGLSVALWDRVRDADNPEQIPRAFSEPELSDCSIYVTLDMFTDGNALYRRVLEAAGLRPASAASEGEEKGTGGKGWFCRLFGCASGLEVVETEVSRLCVPGSY